MRLKLFFIFQILIIHTVFSQNIVINGSFEDLTDKVKEPGSVFLASPWLGGTQAMPDLYTPKAKDDRVAVPVNERGEQETGRGLGENYAGFLLYSYGEKVPRQYLTAKLRYPMLAGEWYCVKFSISLSDLSKYACDNIGAYVSHDSVGTDKELILNFEPQIINSSNQIFEKQWDWDPICRIYVAEGGEQFLTIGNFAPQNGTNVKSVKRPAGSTKTQTRDAYYYIDDITVVPNATKENCKCEPGQFQFAHLEKQESSFETAAEDIPDKVILGTTQEILVMDPTIEKANDDVEILFQKTKSTLPPDGTEKLNEVIKVMKDDVTLTIQVTGYRDGTEKVLKDLSEKRANQVSKYIISKGINKERVTTSDAGVLESSDAASQASNMKVYIVFSE